MFTNFQQLFHKQLLQGFCWGAFLSAQDAFEVNFPSNFFTSLTSYIIVMNQCCLFILGVFMQICNIGGPEKNTHWWIYFNIWQQSGKY